MLQILNLEVNKNASAIDAIYMQNNMEANQMKSITFEEHYVIEDIQKETMNAISADPKGVPMKVMLEGLEKRQVLQMQMNYHIMMNVSNL